MEYENLVEALTNVRLTSKEVYDDAFREFIKQKSDSLAPLALRALLAIQPGHAFQATIVLEDDFELINQILITAGPLSVPRSPHYREVAQMIRAVLPDECARETLDQYVAAGSYIFPKPVPSQWNPVLMTINLFQTPKYDSTASASDDGAPTTTEDNGSISVSLACL